MNWNYKGHNCTSIVKTTIILVLVPLFLFWPDSAKAQNKRVDSLLQIADRYKNKNIDSAFYYSYAAIKQSKKVNEPQVRVKALVYLIVTNIKAGNQADAIIHCSEAMKIVNDYGITKLKKEINMYYGVAYHAAGFSNEAIKYLIEAQKISSTIEDADIAIDLDYYTALAYIEIKKIGTGVKYLNASISKSNANDYPLGAFKSYILFSNIAQQIDTILLYLGKAEQIILENPELAYETVVLRNSQALINKAIGNFDLSHLQYSEAIKIARSNGFDEYLANFNNNFAYLLMAQQNYDSAGIVLAEALQIAKEIGNLDLQASVYDSYADYFAAVGRHDMAFVYQDSSFVKRNQYREQQRIQESRFLSVVFETEQKEKEILTQESEINRLWIFAFAILAFLVAAISAWIFQLQKSKLRKSRLNTVEKEKELDVANAMIQGQNVERERLAMDLHDGLGSRLSVLKFTVENFFKKNERYEEVYDSIKDIHKGVRELSHRMLPAQLENIGLIDTIRNMATELSKSDKYEVGFETNIEGRLPHDLELNLYYLIFELVNNATKHSNGNSIFIQLMDFDDHLNLSVEDNGGNFDVNKDANGVGLQNIKTRVKYLGGKLMIEPSPSETLFIIEIPT